MELSNKSLAILLLAALVVSLGGTMLSLNKIGSIQTVGYATTGTGVVNLTIAASASITTADGNFVNFGACTPAVGTNATVDTENLANTSVVCPYYDEDNISNISVRNDGNVNVTVTIASDTVGPLDNTTGEFLNSSSGQGSLRFKIQNNGRGTNLGGCSPTFNYAPNYIAFNETDLYLPACGKLTPGAVGGENSFVTQFQVNVPYDAPTGEEMVTITYFAAENGS